jgi:glycosyltransferase involved in cell wall biosynthesis
MKNNKLSIAIPTYNRAEILQFNLLQIIDELIEFQIPVYISDDSTNEETYIVINDLKKKHSLIYYRKNEIRFGHDLNCLHTISFPKEQYVWYMGDSMIIKEGSIEKVLNYIQDKRYDFISCNAEGRDLELKTKIFTNGTELLERLCWHLTMTGVTIYNKNTLLDFTKFDVTKFKNFPQTAIIFENFASKDSSLLWINEVLIYGNPQKKSYWSTKVFDVFLNDYKRFILNLNEVYSSKSKDIAITSHSITSGIFNYRSFLKYRADGFFNYNVFCTYKDDIVKYTNTNSFILFFISIFPKPFLKLAKLFFEPKEILK